MTVRDLIAELALYPEEMQVCGHVHSLGEVLICDQIILEPCEKASRQDIDWECRDRIENTFLRIW